MGKQEEEDTENQFKGSLYQHLPTQWDTEGSDRTEQTRSSYDLERASKRVNSEVLVKRIFDCLRLSCLFR